MGGDLIDGSPDRDLGLITDESGETPRLLIAISSLLDRLLAKIATPALPEDHPVSQSRRQISHFDVIQGQTLDPLIFVVIV